MPRAPLSHLFTADVEEYFQVNALEPFVRQSAWDSYASRIDVGVDALLELLASHQALGTFFVLGWIADRHPDVVRRIAAGGHEVASHGFAHRRVTSLTPNDFRRDVRHAKLVLEDISGQSVVGYRAPSFSIVPGHEWAFDVLVEEGYEYDSSIFPIRRPGYGYAGAPNFPYVIERPGGSLQEFPLTTLRVGNVRIPAAGGGYLRHFPYSVIERAFAQYEAEGQPGVFYVHPWELDPQQPRLAVPMLTRLRHYGGLSRTLPRMRQLLSTFRFTSIETARARCLTTIRSPQAIGA